MALTATDVRRLLGRVAFGATPADVDVWTGREYEDLVEHLLTVDARVPLPDDTVRLSFQSGQSDDVDGARIWWLERMRTTPFPLLERMTLVWHNHYATGFRNPPTLAQMLIQNQTLRTHALGSFRALAEAMNVDPAMLYWLNGVENAPPKSNENYAREFFELFTLGKRPQVYTETDIRHAARAFTGWYVDSTNTAQFAESRHSTKKKKVLGRTIPNLGMEEHKELVDVALAQPVAATFLATKLCASLAYVPTSGSDPLVKAVATSLRKDWDIRNAVRVLLLHERFRTPLPSAERHYVRTPAECVVHAAKAFGVQVTSDLTWALEKMGHALFDPIDVSGWPLGREWVSPATALARYEAALAVHAVAADGGVREAVGLLPAADDIAAWQAFLGIPDLTSNTKSTLNAYLARTREAGTYERRAGVVALLLSSPEWVVF